MTCEKIFEATAKVQARKWAFACGEPSVDSRRLEIDDIGSKSAAQQAIDEATKRRPESRFPSEQKKRF